MSEPVRVSVNGVERLVDPNSSALAAVLSSGRPQTRRSVTGEARGPLCGMGICFECRLTIDGVRHQRSCLIPCREGMVITSDG